MASLLKPWIIRYLDAEGRQVTKGTPGARKIKKRTAKWYGQYTDADGMRRRVPLATDKTAARAMLAGLERQVQLGKAGVIDLYVEHRKAPLANHLADFEVHVCNKGVTPEYRKEVMREVRTVVKNCGFRTLADIRPEAVERFLAFLTERGTGTTTRNKYLTSARLFTRWCLQTRKIGEDALACLKVASGAKRRRRRALSEVELTKLLAAARERPLAEALTVRSGPNKGLRIAHVNPVAREALERAGWERALIYKTLFFTGLRRGELEELKTHQLTLDGPRPCVTLPEDITKNREEASIPLRADLVEDLRQWLRATGKTGADRVFRIGRELVRLLKKDLKWAGIAYRDEQGRYVDVHSLRHSTATYLSRAKVAPRAAQRFMRHADIRLTMQTYTDASLLDEAEALNALPDLPLAGPDEAI